MQGAQIRAVMGACVVVGLLVSSGCRGGGAGGSDSPTAPAPQANRAPVINGMSVAPGFGVAFVSPFQMAASASDSDGDPLGFQWQAGSASLTGAIVTTTMGGDGQQTVRLTVTDGRGGTATETRTVTLGNMTGTWSIVLDQCNNNQTAFIGTFTQSGGVFSGTFRWPFAFCNGPAGLTGAIPSDALATIDASGRVSIRVKAAPFVDFFIVGQMDSSGRTIVGEAFGSGLDSVVRLTKQ